jgi:hypothetical protein
LIDAAQVIDQLAFLGVCGFRQRDVSVAIEK